MNTNFSESLSEIEEDPYSIVVKTTENIVHTYNDKLASSMEKVGVINLEVE